MTQENQNDKQKPATQALSAPAGYAGDPVRPQTLGELRQFLEPFDDDCPLMALNYGAFRYVTDSEGNGKIQYA